MFKKKHLKDTSALVSGGIGLGVAQSLAPSVNLSPLTSKMPAMGNIVGTAMVLDSVQGLQKTLKKAPKY